MEGNPETSVPRDVKHLSVVRVQNKVAACQNYVYLSPTQYMDWLRLSPCNSGMLSVGISGRVYQAFPDMCVHDGEIALNRIWREECHANIGDTLCVGYIPVLPRRNACRVVVRVKVVGNRHAIPAAVSIETRVAEALNGQFIAQGGKFVVTVDVVVLVAEIIEMDYVTDGATDACRDDIAGAFVCGETEMWVFV